MMGWDSYAQPHLERALRMIEGAEVLVVGFTMFAERLLLDTRSTDAVPPMIGVVPPVASVEERLTELRRTRPQFPPPERFYFFIWPRRIATFEQSGLWQRIVLRVLEAGHAQAGGDCNRALERLYQLEQEEIQEALQGARYQTLWQRRH
ncbi:MAG: hypothetical protein HYY02_00150 [Chloroflexi bacterium]|nr:hypothetical protein [Chloroflexota bacterium]